jgi:hypothetical protein
VGEIVLEELQRRKSEKQRREPAQKMEERSKLEQVIIDLVWALIWARHCPKKRPNGKKISPPRFRVHYVFDSFYY